MISSYIHSMYVTNSKTAKIHGDMERAPICSTIHKQMAGKRAAKPERDVTLGPAKIDFVSVGAENYLSVGLHHGRHAVTAAKDQYFMLQRQNSSVNHCAALQFYIQRGLI